MPLHIVRPIRYVLMAKITRKAITTLAQLQARRYIFNAGKMAMTTDRVFGGWLRTQFHY